MNYKNIVTEEEIKQLSELASSIWHEYWPQILSLEQINYMVEKFQSFDAMKKQIKNDKYIYNMMMDNENKIGYFGVYPKENYLFLSKLYIQKDFRSKGYGRQAFNKIIETAKRLNKNSIQLNVNKHNFNTIKAYENWGFKAIDTVLIEIGNNFFMDDYIMEYSITEKSN